MNWRDRLRPEIKLTSPSGTEFIASWTGNERSIEKKLGIFEYPKIKGAIVQDLDVGGTKYPLTIFFDGENNDIEARKFFEACKERGVWNVIHPIYGELNLQLMSVTEDSQPVSSGNITKIKTEWIEPIIKGVTSSVQEIENSVRNNAKVLNKTAQNQFNHIVELDAPSKTTQLKNSVVSTVKVIDTALSSLYKQSAEITSKFLSIKRGITQGLTETELDVLGLAGQISTLVVLPMEAIIDIDARLAAFIELLERLKTGTVRPTAANINAVAVQELTMVSIMGAVNQIAIDGNLDSREHAVEIIETISNSFLEITAALDAQQEAYQLNGIDNQYFSQSQTFNSATKLNGQTVSALLRKLFDLTVAKRFTLTRNRAPVEISATEYQSLNRLDFFIKSNKLKGDDILLLPAGREVVVYL